MLDIVKVKVPKPTIKIHLILATRLNQRDDIICQVNEELKDMNKIFLTLVKEYKMSNVDLDKLSDLELKNEQ
jgi:hypothetical protein